MKSLFLVMSLLFGTAAQAGQCYEAFKQSKKLEKMVENVLFMSEGDDSWNAFASWEPVKEVNESEIRRVLNLKNDLYGEDTYFNMESASSLYSFIDSEISEKEENAEEAKEYGYDDYAEYLAEVEKLKKLKQEIEKEYGIFVKLIMFGSGDGDNYFGGDHMMVFIMKNGCILGLKANTAWT